MKRAIKEKKTKFTTNTYMRDVDTYRALIINDNPDYAVVVKKYLKMNKPFVINGTTYLEDGAYLVEITPIHENYNIRFYVSKEFEVVAFYIDITLENGVKNKVPYYIDLYLDIVPYPIENKVCFCDEDELLEALKCGNISKRDYNMAYKVGNKVLKEILTGKNKYFNLDPIPYAKQI